MLQFREIFWGFNGHMPFVTSIWQRQSTEGREFFLHVSSLSFNLTARYSISWCHCGCCHQ